MVDVAAYDPQRRALKPSAGLSRKRAAPATLPANAAWLDHVTLDMAVHGVEDGKYSAAQRRPHLHLAGHKRVLYDLQVSYAPPAAADAMAWVVQRSFREFVALQQRLLTRLRPGHACHAECAWLYNVLKHHFPRKSLFCSACKVEGRRTALLRVLSTLRASLVNRGNLGCAVLRDGVCQEFAAFLLGDLATEAEAETSASSGSDSNRSRLGTVSSAPLLSLAPKRMAKTDSSTSLVSFASEDDGRALEAGDDSARGRSPSCCSSESSSACGSLRRYYRRGSSSAGSVATAGSACCRHRHRDQFRDDYALATPKHGAVTD